MFQSSGTLYHFVVLKDAEYSKLCVNSWAVDEGPRVRIGMIVSL